MFFGNGDVFSEFFDKSSFEHHLKLNFDIEILCNIINVFTVTFDQFNVSLSSSFLCNA